MTLTLRMMIPLALILIGLTTAPASFGGEVRETNETFESHGKKIAVEVFAPKGEEGKHPAVLVLHGSGGMELIGGGLAFRVTARELAKQGYVALVPHYFDRTDRKTADPKAMKDEFVPWMETINDTVDFASKRPDVNPEKIGFVGFSLGAYLALSNATIDPRIKVVVEYFGGLPESLVEKAGKLPPTLVLHGDADVVVPVKEAEKLKALLEKHKIDHEVKIYEGKGHGPLGEDSGKRALAFLDKYLK